MDHQDQLEPPSSGEQDAQWPEYFRSGGEPQTPAHAPQSGPSGPYSDPWMDNWPPLGNFERFALGENAQSSTWGPRPEWNSGGSPGTGIGQFAPQTNDRSARGPQPLFPDMSDMRPGRESGGAPYAPSRANGAYGSNAPSFPAFPDVFLYAGLPGEPGVPGNPPVSSAPGSPGSRGRDPHGNEGQLSPTGPLPPKSRSAPSLQQRGQREQHEGLRVSGSMAPLTPPMPNRMPPDWQASAARQGTTPPQDAGILVASTRRAPRGVVRWWLQFAAPSLPSARWSIGPEQRDLYRRGRLLATAMGSLMLAALVGLLVTSIQLLQGPATSTIIDEFVAPLVVLFCFGLARLNRNGHVELAGFMTGLMVILLIAGALVSSDYAIGGYNWSDTPGYDLMIVGLLFVALTLRAWQSWLMLGLYCFLLLAIVLIVPQSPTVLATDVASGLSAATAAPGERGVAVIVDLLFHPVILATAVVVFGILTNMGVMQALRDRDVQEDLANKRAEINRALQQMVKQDEERRQYFARTATILNTLLVRKPHPDPILLEKPPATWQENTEMMVFHGHLQSLANRVVDGQRAILAIGRWQRWVQGLQNLILSHRAQRLKAQLPAGSSYSELLLLTELPVDREGSRTGYYESDTLLRVMTDFLRSYVAEDEQTRDEIGKAIRKFARGEYGERVPDTLKLTRLGPLVADVNVALDQLAARLREHAPGAASSAQVLREPGENNHTTYGSY